MKGLNLSKFEKTKEDQHSATLQHPHGHEITIFKGGISPSLRDQLSKLPIKEYKDGGEVDSKGERHHSRERDKKISDLGDKVASKQESHKSQHQHKEESPRPGPIGYQSSESFLSRYEKGGEVKGVHQPYGDRNFTHTMTEKEKEGSSLAGEAVRAGSKGDEYGARVGKAEHKRVLEEMKGMKKPVLMADGTDPDVPEQQPLEVDAVDPKNPYADSSAAPAQDAPPDQMEAQPQQDPNEQLPPESQMSPETPIETPDDIKKYLNQETMATGQDMFAGHIKPKTYSDLFEDKSTLGKIGTLFGMLVSGAGSGLSHQPNALMGLMQKQIDNDLNAQEHSAANAQNFLRMRQQQQMNETDIPNKLAQGLITQAQAKGMAAEAEIKARALAHNDAVQATVHDLSLKAMNDPKAQQVLGAIYPEVNALITNKNDQAALLSAYSKRMGFSNPSGGGQAGSPVNYDKMTQLERASQQNVPGAPPAGDLAAMSGEAKLLEQNEANRKLYNNAYSQLDSAFAAGRLTPAQRNAAVADLGAAIGDPGLASKFLPEAGNWKSSRKNIKSAANAYFDAQGAATPKLNQWGVKYQSKPQTQQPQSQSSQSNVIERSVNGRIALYDAKTKKPIGWK